jgi:WD40 repeat protein
MDVSSIRPALRPVGRILINGHDAGSAFTVAPRVALTAGHVVRMVAGQSNRMDSVVYVPEGGSPIAISEIQVDRVLDVALVHLEDAVKETLATAEAVDDMSWRVQSRPRPNDPTLTGTVTDHLRAMRNDQGEDTHLVQLWVQQEVGDYAGYSGSPVIAEGTPFGAVIGVLVEQGRWRKSAQLGQQAPVSNVLFAAPIGAVVSQFGLGELGVSLPAPARAPSGSRSARELSRFGRIDGFVYPPDQICVRIRESLCGEEAAGIVVFTGHSGYGKTGLAGWAARDPEVQGSFARMVAVEFKDDWPPSSRGDRAFEDFRGQIGAGSGPFEESDFDAKLVSGSTLLIFDDVRTTSDLKQFFGFFDRCTVLVTAVESRISTDLTTGGRSVTHFDLTSPQESAWVSVWARSILTQSWPTGAAIGDLVKRCGSSPLLVARLNREVIHRAASRSSVVAFNHAIEVVETALSELGPTTFDYAGDADRSVSFGASIEYMLQRISSLPPPPSNPADRFKELGALPADVRVPVEVLDELWESGEKEATRRLVERLSDMHMLQFEPPEPGSYQRGRVRLLDSDRDYLRKVYPEHISRAHRRLVGRADQGKLSSPVARDYWTEHRIWHLIGAEEYERLTRELADPESLVTAALSRGVRSVEHDLALVLAPPSQLPNKDLLLGPLQSRIRQCADLLKQCGSRESFCPTLAARLQGEPALDGFAADLSRYTRGAILVVKGAPHDMNDRRLIQRLPKRAAGVKAVSWLAEPYRIGIAYQDGSARIWEPHSDLYSSRPPDSTRAAAACWSQSGGDLAIGRSDGTVTVWPPPNGTGPEDLQEQGVTCVAWSKKGELAYAGWRGDLVYWSPDGGTRRRATNIGGMPVTALAWSDAGTQLAFASAQGTVFIISADGPVQILPADPGGAASLAWSGKGPLACAGWDGTVRVAEPDGTLCGTQPEPSDPRGPPAIAWDQDGERLAIGGYDGAVSVWCAGVCRSALQPQFRRVRALAWSPTAPLLAAAHDVGVIRIWHETDRDPTPPILAHGTSVVGVGWSSRDDHLVAAGSDGTVTIWAPFKSNDALRSVIRTDGPTMVRCSPDGRTVATAQDSGAIRLWDVETREPRASMVRAARKPAVGWAPTGASRIAIGGADGVVHEWTAGTEWDSRVVHEHSTWVSDLAWSRNEQLATLGRDWVLHISQPSRATYDLLPHEGGTTAIAWSPQGSLLATAGNDWLVRIWCPPDSVGAAPPLNGQWGLVAQFRAHLGGVTALEWAPGGTELATAGWDRCVRRWQLRLPAAPAPFHQSNPVSWRLTDTWRTRASAVSVLAWSPDGTCLVGGDRRGRLQAWRCGDPSSTKMRSSHEGPLTALRWSKTANRILSTGTDGTLRLWSAHGEECARIVFYAPLYSLDLHDDSGLVAVGGEYGATILQLRIEATNDGVKG